MEVFQSREHTGLANIARQFLASHDLRAQVACFGVAGPVRRGRVAVSNLPWVIDAAEIAGILAIKSVSLINDLEANAYGISLLSQRDLVTLNPGTPDAAGNQALIAAGTGLGEAGLAAVASGHRPFATEGGHTDFGPRNELEIDLLRYLLPRFGHVSYERVLSGMGLESMYQFFRDTGRATETPDLVAEMAGGDPGAIISKHGLAGTSELCVRVLDLFVSVYGAEAGNLALKIMATGGLYIGGGIAPKILPKLQSPAFLQVFFAKGRMEKILREMPVYVITNDLTALLGAARYAAMSMSQ
jgi:glucokinase